MNKCDKSDVYKRQVNEMEGMEWVTVIEGQKEYLALQFMCSDMVLDPAALVWGQAKKGLPCDLKSEFRKIKREAEAVLDDSVSYTHLKYLLRLNKRYN